MLKQESLQTVVDGLVKWIQDQVKAAGVTGTVFGLSGGADSALVALLCKKAFPENAVGVMMPCHSSRSSVSRAEELAASINLKTVLVDLSAAHDSITAQVAVQQGNLMAEAGLRSCLRAPTLDYVAKLNNALIIGTGNRDEDEVARYYQKRGDGAVDCSPIAKLHKSEVYQLLRFLGCPQSIIDAVPTADLWGPDSGQADEKEMGITYAEMEWAIQENDKHGIIAPDTYGYHADDPFYVLDYTPRQVQVIRTLRKMESASRHKAVPPPVYEIRRDSPELFEGYVEPDYKNW